ncbi:MAG: hypothetical protein OXU78_08670 [Deltaproteobacteria bacterium]|nr:hypothetical protein [Deltaproteobacteria bacterium]
MNEQNANGRNANGRRFRLYEIIIAGLLAAFFAALLASDQRSANQVEALDRKMEALSRKVEENSRILVEVQTTLKLIASGLDIRVETKEQAGPAAGTGGAPAPGEKLATKDP